MEDIELIVKLRMELIVNNAALGKTQNDENGSFYEIYKNTRKYYEEHLSSDDHMMYLVLCDGAVAACGGAYTYQELPSYKNVTGKCGRIVNIYTKPEYRQKGIATALLKYLIDKLRAAGMEKIYLRTTKIGRSVYEKIGFSEMKDCMELTNPN